MTKKLCWIMLVALLGTPAQGRIVHLDPHRAPDPQKLVFNDWASARAALQGGDELRVSSGSYPAIVEARQPEDIFDDWVTIRAEENANVSFDSLKIGARGSRFNSDDGNGVFQAKLRFENLTFTDGVFVYGAKHVEINRCRLRRIGPWVGSKENIEKTACSVEASQFVTVANCDITETGNGFSLSGKDFIIRDNSIYEITHDGIRCIGLHDSVVSGNTIRNLDDGVTDQQASWSRHCDGIHIFICGAPAGQLRPNKNLVFDGNVLSDIESQGVQFNNYYSSDVVRNSGIIFQNNVFGATGTITFNNADPVDGLIFRHNTFLPWSSDFNNPNAASGRTIRCENHTLRISERSTGVEVYNNILGSSQGTHPDAKIFDYNLIQFPREKEPYARYTILGANGIFLQASSTDASLAAGSPAIDKGRPRSKDDLGFADITGATRDSYPDLGAVEFPTATPLVSNANWQPPGTVIRLFDDFEDANLLVDPELKAGNTRGIGWQHDEEDGRKFFLLRNNQNRNALSTPVSGGDMAVVYTSIPEGWREFRIRFIATNAYLTEGGGFILRSQDSHESLAFDLGTGSGEIRHYSGGNSHPVTVVPRLRLPAQTPVTISIERRMRGTGKAVLRVVPESGVIKEISCPWGKDAAPDQFGFFHNSERSFHGIAFDNIELLKIPRKPQGLSDE